MNKEKLKKLIYDIESESKDIEDSLKLLENYLENDILRKEISNSLKYKYLSMFILYEDFISMLLKEYNIYKIGITVDVAIKLLKEKNIFSDEIANYLNSARLIRNRIGHRYKQLKIETLVNFLEENIEVRNSLFEFVKSFLK
ncbi:HepT-like ribonuclease domain-containing protein [Clostridium sp. 1001271B_151109_B4]|uniref:HepT-like ribonuclease domain-containing protein n=1 Tax=Clostridium sp. 1001271B_151109_B4 TaxID=2787148 RepID=UPI0018AA6B29